MVRVLTVDNLRRHSRRHLMPSSAAALCAAALVALSASSSAVAQVAVPTDDPANGNTTTGVGPLIADYTDDTTQSSYAEHTCNHDSPALQSAIYGSHSLNETDGLFDGCDARRPYCIKSDGIYRRGYTVVALKSGGSSGDDLILQSGEPYTTVVLAQNYEGDGNSSTSSKGFKGAGVGPLRITVRTDALTTSGKYCTSASGTIPSFAGGTATCDSTTILTDARRSFLLNTLVPKAVAMLTSRLNVNQISGNLLVPSTTVCTSQHVVASSDVTQGIANTDFAIYLTAAPTAAGTIAWGGTCAMDTKNRPIVGMINISPAYMDAGTDANTDHVARVVVHEMMHALGFSGGYISSKMPSNLKSTTRRGEPVSLFTGSKSNGGQQTFFGCSTVDGVEIENEGAVGSSGSHWKRRSYLEDIMSPVAGSTMVISSMTLGYFEDTGNYFPDYTQAEDATWLKGSGCGTFDSTCITTRGGQGKWFCNTNSDPTCTANYKAIGACNIKTYTTTIPSYWQYFSDPAIGGTQGFMGYCPIVTEYSNRLCYDSTTATTNTVQAQYYGTGGRCFTTSATLLAAGWGFGSTNPGPARCMQSRCLDGTQVQFQIGTYASWISCPADGSVVTLDMADYGYTGTVTCPPAADFCTSDICYGSCSSTSATAASTTSTTTTTTKPTTTTSTTTTTKPTTTTTTSTTTTTKKPTTTTTTTTKPTTTTSTTTTTKPTTTTTTTTKPTTTTTTSTTTKKPATTTTSTTTTKPTTTSTTTTKPTTTTTTTAKPTTTTTTSTTTQPPATTTTTTGGKQPASCSSYLLSGTSPSTVLSTAQINLLLKGHNDARQAVKPYAKSMPMLQWDQKLANFAQSYLDTCPGLSYSPVSRRMYNANFSDWWYIGENMAAGPEVKPDNLQGVVDAWVEGGAGYQYPTCVSGWCGAYTQIVWAASTSIGCAYKYCPNDQYQYYWVCNFGVGGNVQGQNPYETTPYVSESAECTSDRYDASTGSASATDACDASYFVSGTSPSTTLSTDTINVILKGHNDLRRDVTPYANTMPMLQWNQKLADFAQSYLSTCPGLANSDAKTRLSNANFPNWWYVGESMAAGEELTPDYVQDVIAAWSATDYFTYPNSCASGGTYVCTTYKQMIWAQTTDIGCAYQYCPNEPYKYYWVCNYGVGGSVQGQAPYANQTDLSQSADCTRARTSSTSAQSRGMNAMGVTHRRSSSAAAVSVIADTLIFSQDTATGVTAEAANGVVMPPTDNSLAAASISSSADALEQPPKTTLKKSLAEKLRAASEKAKAAVGEDAKPGKSQLEL